MEMVFVFRNPRYFYFSVTPTYHKSLKRILKFHIGILFIASSHTDAKQPPK